MGRSARAAGRPPLTRAGSISAAATAIGPGPALRAEAIPRLHWVPARCLSRSRPRFHGVNTHEAQGATSGGRGGPGQVRRTPRYRGSRPVESAEVSPILFTVLPGWSRGGACKAFRTHRSGPQGRSRTTCQEQNERPQRSCRKSLPHRHEPQEAALPPGCDWPRARRLLVNVVRLATRPAPGAHSVSMAMPRCTARASSK